jgi:hypothetical protein
LVLLPLKQTTCLSQNFTELTSSFDSFDILNKENVKDLISKSSKKSRSLDPIPTLLVLKCQDILLPVITRMIKFIITIWCVL